MDKTKYYYSKYVQKVHMEVYTDSSGHPNLIPDKPFKFIEFLPRVIVASVLSDDKKTLTFGVAICCKHDRFKKSEGRRIAYERATNCPKLSVILRNRNKISEISNKYAQQLIDEALEKYV